MKKFFKSLRAIWTGLVLFLSPFLVMLLVNKLGLIQGIFAGLATVLILTLSPPTIINLFRDPDSY